MADQIPFAVVAGAVENGIVSSSTFSKRHDFMERPLARSAIILFALLVVAPCEGMAQRSHGGSHAHGGSHTSGSRAGGAFGGMGGGQRWGTPAASGYDSQGHGSSSPPWTLHAPNSSSHSGLNYSAGSGRAVAYGGYGAPVQYHNHGHQDYGSYSNGVNLYNRLPIYNGLSIQYSSGYGLGNGYGYGPGLGYGVMGIIAPPIAVPYGSYNTTPFLAPLPSIVQLAAPPTPAEVAAQFSSGNVATGTLPQGLAADMSMNGELLSQRFAADETPIVNEFGNDFKAISEAEVSAVNRIRSLRYQTSGDNAFRQQDYVSAEVFYTTAAETAAVRRAPWLRLAWVQVAQQKHAAAVSSLKTALHLHDDPTSSWVSGEDLFGSGFESNSIAQDEDLWMWLQVRPNSTDRLLLVAAFQQLRGYPGVAKELLDAASRNGLDRTVVTALREISDVQNRPVGDQRPPGEEAGRPQSGTRPSANPIADDGGIRMRGRDVVPASYAAEEVVGLPEPLLSGEDLPPVNSEADAQPVKEMSRFAPPVSSGQLLTIPPMKSPSP